jgi:hypothetical protein
MKNIPVIICLLIVLGSSFIYVSEVVIISEKQTRLQLTKEKLLEQLKLHQKLCGK